MNRTARDRTGDGPRPVQRIELNEDKLHMRFILAVVLLAFGVGMILLGLNRLLTSQGGWHTVEVATTDYNCAGDFVFYYELGRSGGSATAERKQLQLAYTQASVDAYKLFSPNQRFEGLGNLASLSDSLNRPVQVEPELYAALEEIAASGSRLMYLAPVYEMYYSLFHSQNELEAAAYDPFTDPDLGEWCRQAAEFASDPEHIRLELGGNDTVTLRVSEEYQAFLREAGITEALDLFWMRNAFAADLMAERLIAAGFTHGCLSSRNGFVRNLDGRGGEYGITVYDRRNGKSVPAGELVYTGPMALAAFHAASPEEGMADWYYTMPDGSVRSPYVDPRDGLCRTALPDLLCLSREKSCAELALRVSLDYVGDAMDPASLLSEGIGCVWCADREILSTADGVSFRALYTDEAGSYSVQTGTE